jgi:hypothetical protein
MALMINYTHELKILGIIKKSSLNGLHMNDTNKLFKIIIISKMYSF